MSTDALPDSLEDIEYPESDGKPLADNTRQLEWIVMWKGNVDALFADDPQVAVFGDLLWYPVEGDPEIRQAPDVMVVFGRPKGHRRSYLQWREGDIPPQVAVEILSHKNTRKEMERKRLFYEKYGVLEYYVYNPETFQLRGYLREGDALVEVPHMDQFTSPLLKMRFDLSGGELQLWYPDGSPFKTVAELRSDLQTSERERELLERERDQVRGERDQAEARRRQAEAERDAVRLEAERMRERLKALGIDPDNV